MKIKQSRWLTGGLVLTAFAAGMAVNAVPNFTTFTAGTPIVAADMNANFAAIKTWATEQEKVAGYVTKDNGAAVPFYRKVLTGTKGGQTDTLTHGLSSYNIASGRKILHCDVMVNYDSTGATIALNLDNGSATASWCDFTDTQVEIQWATTTLHSSGANYYVVIDYVRNW